MIEVLSAGFLMKAEQCSPIHASDSNRWLIRRKNNAMGKRGSQGTRVVSVGRNSDLLALRHAVLELGGFQVFSTSSMSVAQAFLRHKRCGVLVLCYSVPENWRKTLIHSFRSACPNGRIVGIVRGDLKRVSESFDVVMSSTDKADALLDAVVGGERRGHKAG
jgi:hypothetical protein